MRILFTFLVFTFCCNSWANKDLDKKLLRCVESGDLNCVKTALENGADITAQGSWGQNSLHYAVNGRRLGIIKWLVKKNPSPDYVMSRDYNQSTPLHHAAINGQLKIVKFLLKVYPDRKHISAKDGRNRTPLMWAIHRGKTEIVQFLISQDSSLEHIMARDTVGGTPLYWAASQGRLEAVRLLAQLYPATDLLSRDNTGKTAFEAALEETFMTRKRKIARIIFGNSSPKVKRVLLHICQNNTAIDQQFCEQLASSFDNKSLQESGGYQ